MGISGINYPAFIRIAYITSKRDEPAVKIIFSVHIVSKYNTLYYIRTNLYVHTGVRACGCVYVRANEIKIMIIVCFLMLEMHREMYIICSVYIVFRTYLSSYGI